MQNLHEFTWTTKDVGDCGARGCRGHRDYTVSCSCGWSKTFKNEYFAPDARELMLQHRLERLERASLTGD